MSEDRLAKNSVLNALFHTLVFLAAGATVLAGAAIPLYIFYLVVR